MSATQSSGKGRVTFDRPPRPKRLARSGAILSPPQLEVPIRTEASDGRRRSARLLRQTMMWEEHIVAASPRSMTIGLSRSSGRSCSRSIGRWPHRLTAAARADAARRDRVLPVLRHHDVRQPAGGRDQRGPLRRPPGCRRSPMRRTELPRAEDSAGLRRLGRSSQQPLLPGLRSRGSRAGRVPSRRSS